MNPALKRLTCDGAAPSSRTIGHMKTDGRLTRCPLKGTLGDALFAVLCGCGHS